MKYGLLGIGQAGLRHFEAFKKISSFLKPGGYLIFGDPNKAGGFQNMLQRYAVYNFSNSENDMIKVSEYLFKEDIDRFLIILLLLAMAKNAFLVDD